MQGNGRRAGAVRAMPVCALMLLAGGMLLGPAAGAVTLQEAVRAALTTNPKVSRAEATRSAASHDVRDARAGYLPSLDASGGGGREISDIKANGAQRALTVRQFSLTLRQMLFDGMATSGEVDRRVSLLDAASENLSDTRESVAFRAVQVYFDVLKARHLVDLAADNVSSHRDTLDKVKLKADRGLASTADVDQARGRLALAQSTLTAREGSLREAMANYRRVVGEYPGDLREYKPETTNLVKDGTIDKAALAEAVKQDTAAALEEHPALAAAKAQVKAADAQVEVARSAYFPRLDVEAGITRDDNIGGVEGNRNTDSIMLVGRWNLYRGGGDRAREQASAERRAAAQDAAADTRRAIEENVAIAVQAKATSQARLEYLRQHVDSSAKTLRAYQQQFDLGRRSLLDLLNAKSELFQARSDYAAGLYDDLVNRYFVEASKGVLVKGLGLSAAAAPANQSQ